MSHIRDCPEFRLARSDSKNPATTCAGLTADGRKCRRTVVSSNQKNGEDEKLKAVRQVFCWQHQDQAKQAPVKVTTVSTLRGRSSLDTLVERVGLLDVEDGPQGKVLRPKERDVRAAHRPRRERREAQGGREHRRQSASAVKPQTPALRPEPISMPASAPAISSNHRKKPSAGRRFVCFITRVDDDEIPDLKIRRRSMQARPSSSSEPRVARTPSQYQSHRPATSGTDGSKRRSRPVSTSSQHTPQQHLHPDRPPRSAPGSTHVPARPSMLAHTGSASSHTQTLLSWIPSNVSPETASKLLQKLSEPLSSADVPGYIYIYCVTPLNSVPSPDAISSLIPTSKTPETSRRTSDVMRTAGVQPNRVRDQTQNRTTNTITLKIGRAVNVSRRLTQQCHQNLTLVRYYPYSPSSPDAPAPRKAPNIHRLERLVHLELADRRFKLQDPCGQCGKRHQEYFEIEADKKHLRLVDECVRRWVRYSEQYPDS